MRSCLIQSLILVVVAFALLWFGLPIGASWLATNALNASGFSGTNTRVDVSSNPPPKLLLGQADSVHITSTQVGIHDLHAASMDFTLGDVALLDRTIGTVDGKLTGVQVPAPDGEPVVIDQATVDGKASAALATLYVSNSQVESLVASQIKAQTGISAAVSLAAPNKVTIKANGQTLASTLQVRSGELDLIPEGNSLPTVILLKPGNGNPFTLTSVAIGSQQATLSGTIDLETLLKA